MGEEGFLGEDGDVIEMSTDESLIEVAEAKNEEEGD